MRSRTQSAPQAIINRSREPFLMHPLKKDINLPWGCAETVGLEDNAVHRNYSV